MKKLMFLMLVLFGASIFFNSCKDPVEEITCVDFEGNSYSVAQYGEAWWMTENLKSKKYSDGTAIPNVQEGANTWGVLEDDIIDKAYCENSLYGVLYTFAAASNGEAPTAGSGVQRPIQGACPTGWHLPTDVEWNALQTCLIDSGLNYNGASTGNLIAKSMCLNSGWSASSVVGSPGSQDNVAMFNKSGFSAKPTGYIREAYGDNLSPTGETFWWTATESTVNSVRVRSIHFDSSDLGSSANYMSRGLAIRCVKD